MNFHDLRTSDLFDDAPYLREFSANVLAATETALALDRTCFYPQGGGQPGDTGQIFAADRVLKVTNTYRDRDNPALIWHDCEPGPDGLMQGEPVQGVIDWERRYGHMRMHTCLHLLCSLIDAPVTGCSIAADKGRLDFDLPEMTLDKDEISRRLNELIEVDHPVRRVRATENLEQVMRLTRTKSIEAPVRDGKINLVQIADVDLQPCGGTHVASSREIGRVVCAKIEKKSRHNRRVSIRFT
ncbi:MAG TPA: alanyl-tRNA editing protein [Rhodopseudomonas sp.]|uniref:alanyl-tRNA editing protein n=1 Tax=Rhodopseudomonas sp. TaxID=1078 RepID=UPI002ED80A4C